MIQARNNRPLAIIRNISGTPDLVTPLTLDSPGLFRRLASMVYDGLLLVALLFVVTFIFTLIFGSVAAANLRYVLQGLLWLVMGAYFLWYWTHGGQTLAMQTWRIRLLHDNDAPLTLKQALLRYVAASAGVLFFGAGLIWALFDREGLFLHDRLVGTRLVLLPARR